MKLIKETKSDGKTVIGYMMRLSAFETGDWARRVGAAWPCSQLKDRRLWVCVDDNGLYDISTPREVDNNELSACVGDHLPDDCKHLWPCWE